MKKIAGILFINLIALIITVLAADVIIYTNYARNFYKTHASNYSINKFKYITEEKNVYLTKIDDYFNGKDIIQKGRLPDGTEYKNASPIIIFGCSFAHGQYLPKEETVSYKLAHILKRPVYNRAIPGGSFQHMYYQTKNQCFYDEVPASDTVIYIMMNDHYRRALVNFFDILDHHFILHYSIKNNNLVMADYNNPIKNLFKSLYISKLINQKYFINYISNPKNNEKLTDLTLQYFIQTRNNLEKAYEKKIKFVVVLYDNWNIKYKSLLKKKLNDCGFITVDTSEITKEDLNSEKYLMKGNNHPTSEAWDLLIPGIIEGTGI